ncbi:hypothetical protein F4779DRAFT_218923 [Xylariaceae sp. FL0662B]|nr:hypothetical protein F4779DRAFT_218923 [Xylariaceae sp. FL0662B]
MNESANGPTTPPQLLTDIFFLGCCFLLCTVNQIPRRQGKRLCISVSSMVQQLGGNIVDKGDKDEEAGGTCLPLACWPSTSHMGPFFPFLVHMCCLLSTCQVNVYKTLTVFGLRRYRIREACSRGSIIERIPMHHNANGRMQNVNCYLVEKGHTDVDNELVDVRFRW